MRSAAFAPGDQAWDAGTCSPPLRASARYAQRMLPLGRKCGAGLLNWRPLGTYHDSLAGRVPEER